MKIGSQLWGIKDRKVRIWLNEETGADFSSGDYGCGFLLAGRIEVFSCPNKTKIIIRTGLSYKPSAPIVESRCYQLPFVISISIVNHF